MKSQWRDRTECQFFKIPCFTCIKIYFSGIQSKTKQLFIGVLQIQKINHEFLEKVSCTCPANISYNSTPYAHQSTDFP